MPNNYILKDFAGGAQTTTLTAGISAVATSFAVGDGSTYPSGGSPFCVVIDRGLATEEKILCSDRTGNSFTVLERGYDGSSAQAHSSDAVVEHVLDAYTIEQANRHANLQTTKGDVVVHDGTVTQRLAVGANDTVFVADSAQAVGAKWAKLEMDSLSATAVSDIADAVEAAYPTYVHPAGAISQFAGSSAPSGWLLCDGASVSTTTYASLFAVVGYTYGGSGSSFNLPNLKGKVPVGFDSTQTEFDALGETGGAKTHTLTEAEMPAHDHSINHDHAAVTSGAGSAHSHDISVYQDLGTSDDIDPNGQTNLWVTGMEPNATTYGSSPGSAQAESAHTHSVNLPNYTGTSGSAGSGSAHNNLQPYVVLNYIIKA